MQLPTIADVRAAALRIAPYVRHTPVLTDAAIDAASGAVVCFKCENLQQVGAFKFRGAANAVWSLSDEQARRGVVTHSSGNHGAALGLAARLRNIPAFIVVPDDVPEIKLSNMRETGAQLHVCAPTIAAREQAAAQLQSETGAMMVHPYANPDVIAGQGTAALELLTSVPNLDVIVTPVGGGGLVSGTAIAAHAIRPGIRIIAAEPENAADAYRAMTTGQREPHPAVDTLCDGLRASIGAINFDVMRNESVQVVTVTDAQTVVAMRMLWDRLKLVVESSAAISLAAILAHPEIFRGQRIGVILTGGNVDLDALPWR